MPKGVMIDPCEGPTDEMIQESWDTYTEYMDHCLGQMRSDLCRMQEAGEYYSPQIEFHTLVFKIYDELEPDETAHMLAIAMQRLAKM